jgi:hypothetical protein
VSGSLPTPAIVDAWRRDFYNREVYWLVEDAGCGDPAPLAHFEELERHYVPGLANREFDRMMAANGYVDHFAADGDDFPGDVVRAASRGLVRGTIIAIVIAAAHSFLTGAGVL